MLWPAGTSPWSKLCVVLDAAHDERIFAAVERCYLDKCCLYAGRLPWVLQRAAPHLVVLDRADRFTRYLIAEGWGDCWGIFLRTERPMMDLRRHLRTLLRVQDQSGRKLIFRWYDPRVLRVYLPTCTSEELRTFFGPVERFYCEGRDPSTLWQYRLDNSTLRSETCNLSVTKTATKDSTNAGMARDMQFILASPAVFDYSKH